MTIITPVPGIKLHDIRPEVPAFVAQVNIICRSYRLTASNTLAPTKILSIYPKYLLIKTPVGKIKDKVSLQTILTIFVVSFDPFYFPR